MSRKLLTPVFLSTPDALLWANKHDWAHMLMVDGPQEAQQFICGVRQETVPVWLVEMRCQYKTRATWLRDCSIARLFVHIEPHEPPEVWNEGEWEIGLEVYVGGTRALEYPDRERYKRMGIVI